MVKVLIDTGFGLLDDLGRPWQPECGCYIGLYDSDEYWVRDCAGHYWPVNVSSPGSSREKELYLGEI